MGREATVARRKVVSVAEECLNATNKAIGSVEELRGAHNGLKDAVGRDVTDLMKRHNVLASWIGQTERNAVDKRALPAVLVALDREYQEREADLKRKLTTKLECLSGRLAYFETMTFWQRMRHLFFGDARRLPEDLHFEVSE